MIEGKIEIYLSHKEPIFKETTLWLRPYLDREGYELLFYGANGWEPLMCGPRPPQEFKTPKREVKHPVKIKQKVEERVASCGCSN